MTSSGGAAEEDDARFVDGTASGRSSYVALAVAVDADADAAATLRDDEAEGGTTTARRRALAFARVVARPGEPRARGALGARGTDVGAERIAIIARVVSPVLCVRRAWPARGSSVTSSSVGARVLRECFADDDLEGVSFKTSRRRSASSSSATSWPA